MAGTRPVEVRVRTVSQPEPSGCVSGGLRKSWVREVGEVMHMCLVWKESPRFSLICERAQCLSFSARKSPARSGRLGLEVSKPDSCISIH